MYFIQIINYNMNAEVNSDKQSGFISLPASENSTNCKTFQIDYPYRIIISDKY